LTTASAALPWIAAREFVVCWIERMCSAGVFG
jgi:hypothetical protein